MIAWLAATGLLLFVCLYSVCVQMLRLGWNVALARKRLYPEKNEGAGRFPAWLNWKMPHRVERHLSLLLESTGKKATPRQLLAGSIMLAVLGGWFGFHFFMQAKGALMAGSILGAMPYFLIRMRQVGFQRKARMEFLPAVEVFYQVYTLYTQRNMRSILGELLQNERIRYPLKTAFEQLERNLAAGRDPELGFAVFRAALGHKWADYFADMLWISFTEGSDITENLQQLIRDMRKAQLSASVERNRLLEIRIANFSPMFFFGVFLFVNFRLDRQLAYEHYFLDPAGRQLLLEACWLIFLSFLMGLYLSVRKGGGF